MSINVIGISGKSFSGKNVFADYLVEALFENTGNEYKTMAYADILKSRLISDFDMSYEQFYSDLKEIPDHRFPKSATDSSLGFWTPREMMTFYGTDCYKTIDNLIWIKLLFKNITKNKFSHVIVTDCRFKDEVDAIKDRGGVHIKIIRPDSTTTVVGKSHISECQLDEDYKVDIKILNVGTLEDLKKSAIDTAVIFKQILFNKEVL